MYGCSRCFIRGIDGITFRSGEWARILSVVMIKPKEDSKWRPCFHVEFPDGMQDFWVIDELYRYEFGLRKDTQNARK